MIDPRYIMPRPQQAVWTDSYSNRFEVLATYSPNEDNDTWVEYRNMATGQEYCCRLEAFQSRFHPQPA